MTSNLIPEKTKVKSYIALISTLLFLGQVAANDTDIAPTAGPLALFPPSDSVWDLLFFTSAEPICNDDQLLGVTFADQWFFVTGGGNNADPNYVYVLNSNGSLNFSFEQSITSTSWGWRDLCYDGTYLYGSCTYTVEAFDTAGNLVPAMNVNGPSLPNRALAYDPISDTFWTQSFSGPIYNFDRTGTVLYTGTSGVIAAYGAAWHDPTNMLWIFSQEGTPQTTLYEYDPVDHELTGSSYTVQLIAASTDQIAGGMSWTDQYDPLLLGGAFIGMTQGTPEDQLFVLEAPENSPIPVEFGARNPGVLEDFITVSNYPNPFNNQTIIRFELPIGSFVTLEVFDINGRNVGASLRACPGSHGGLPLQDWYSPGTHQILFDGSELASGVYLYRLKSFGSGVPITQSGKMVLMK
ncbi:hypothetical protein CEE37_03105 [candidate division LCP-89 bacterium B3_LCP]|uniref:Secretion system C-terminal sorting domain-containing protein n=1 Tax=candidate division LCP-89 bacterium B3_LCP TaxID=2012998 RepID=A0A532V349_UNCL8|nr:MAG: hypothetical protein CEE37_03105 [candidate division LCP-89 bacterium B3_LCP]